jgi:Asp-tRNAAsn/Glu-tRNAGln amidotransferase A subunit and related amidases
MKLPAELETLKPRPLLLLKREEISRQSTSPIEEISKAMKNAESENREYNDYITLNSHALEDASRVEAELRAGIGGALSGIPISVKDIFLTKGMRTTMGSRLFEHYIPDRDARVVSSLREAGAVVIGKTNLHEFASGVTNLSSLVGPARNPHDKSRITGGSSGGSAASVALGSALASLGTDTSGSVRIPAALCGIVGYKPTYDMVSREGVFPLAWSLDHVGVLARTVSDAAYVTNVLEGSSGSIDLPSIISGKDPARISLAYLEEDLEFYNKSLDSLRSEGINLAPVKLDLEGWGSVQRVIRLAEAASVHREYLETSSHLYSPDVAELLKQGSRIEAVDYIDSLRKRREITDQYLRALRDRDGLLTPTVPTTAPKIDEVRDRELQFRSVATKYVSFVNYLGAPAITLPSGEVQGLPVGLQLVGRPWQDSQLLTLARTLEALLR